MKDTEAKVRIEAVISDAVVHLCCDADTSELVAVKKTELNEKNEMALANEIYMLKTLSHPNIVSYITSYFLTPQFVWVCHQISRAY